MDCQKNLLTKKADMNEAPTPQIDLWGGIECTINRVGNEYFDQLDYSGHYNRENDIDHIAAIPVKKLRYPGQTRSFGCQVLYSL